MIKGMGDRRVRLLYIRYATSTRRSGWGWASVVYRLRYPKRRWGMGVRLWYFSNAIREKKNTRPWYFLCFEKEKSSVCHVITASSGAQ